MRSFVRLSFELVKYFLLSLACLCVYVGTLMAYGQTGTSTVAACEGSAFAATPSCSHVFIMTFQSVVSLPQPWCLNRRVFDRRALDCQSVCEKTPPFVAIACFKVSRATDFCNGVYLGAGKTYTVVCMTLSFAFAENGTSLHG